MPNQVVRIRILRGLLVCAVLSPLAVAQEFEVAAIRPNSTGDQSYRIRTPPGGRFTATNVSVKTLILEAFDIKDFQLAGAPGWIESERYDVDAKIGTQGDSQAVISQAVISQAVISQAMISPEGLRPLLRSLLAARFGLTFHHETREVTVYGLSAPKGGSKLHESTGTPAHSTDWGKGRINATDVTVAEFGRVLETQLDRLVVDDTGIHGAFDFHLTWTPEQANDMSGPSLFTALQEQYGLKLDSRKGPAEMLVIDHVDKPSEN